MKKNLNIKIDINMRKKLVIFSELLFLFIVIGSSTAMADTGSLEINTASEIQNNAINQTDSFPKLEHAPENPEFVKYLNNKIYTQNAPSQNEYQTGLVPAPVDLSHLSDISAYVSAPAYYDLRALNRVTSVKDQGLEGTCWAVATYASMESCLMPG